MINTNKIINNILGKKTIRRNVRQEIYILKMDKEQFDRDIKNIRKKDELDKKIHKNHILNEEQDYRKFFIVKVNNKITKLIHPKDIEWKKAKNTQELRYKHGIWAGAEDIESALFYDDEKNEVSYIKDISGIEAGDNNCFGYRWTGIDWKVM